MTYDKGHQPKKTVQKACADCDALKKEIVSLKAELVKMREIAGRAQADLQNSKDRLRKESEEIRKFAMEGAIVLLLPTIDNFQRAFAHLPEELKNNEWVKGVQAIESDLVGKLTALGLVKVESLGKTVDHVLHEVLQEGEGEEGKVIEVFEEGYMFNGKVVRHAKVKVGKKLKIQNS